MPDYCFYCGDQISKNNSTEEHIFLAGLGDKLKTKTLLCRKCNSLLGDFVDSPLINDMKQFVNFSMIKTREKNQNVIVTDNNTNHKYLFNPLKNEYKLLHDYVDFDKKGNRLSINGEFRDEESVLHFKKKLKKKYPSLNISKSNIVHRSNRPWVTVKLPINPPNYVLAVLKMAIEFSLICGVTQQALAPRINLLKDFVRLLQRSPKTAEPLLEKTAGYIHPFGPVPEDMKQTPKRMQAKLYSSGKTIYCWISILGLYSYTISMNTPPEISMEINRSVYYYGDSEKFRRIYKNFNL